MRVCALQNETFCNEGIASLSNKAVLCSILQLKNRKKSRSLTFDSKIFEQNQSFA